MKYIDAAIVRLKSKKTVNESDLSLVERILAKETDPKMAYIFALDLILVGIDTASSLIATIVIIRSVRVRSRESGSQLTYVIITKERNAQHVIERRNEIFIMNSRENARLICTDINGSVLNIISISDETGGAGKDSSGAVADLARSFRSAHDESSGSSGVHEGIYSRSVQVI